MNDPMQIEIKRRRTFAIISHPDAGKTTLTEKLLLYGGAIELAGSVTARKKQRETSSDWMELEKKRGISISSTVLQFDYNGFRINLLDTPGHKDFSEDTYRVLMAVDAVVMVIDAGKGIESQTLKLFEICKKRGIPIFTFINKLDRPALPPLELLDQIEKVLGMHACPVCWPLENGAFFKGVYDRITREVHLFEKVPGGAYKAPVSVHDITDPFVKGILSESSYNEIMEELEMLDGAQKALEINEVHAGKTTPVFFGSAANNFGVEMLLKGFLEYSNEPLPRKAGNEIIPLDGPAFSAFVFKIQTNMNPQHRDRMVFARICSGRFFRDMTVYNTRNNKEVRISNSHNVFGRERETANEAFAGDIIGFVTNADFRIGDTLSSDPEITFNEIPRFAPECFAYIRNVSSSSYKSFRKGIEHLLAEDIVQSFFLKSHAGNIPLLGAVGPLQFDVLQYRLKDEYGVDSNLEMKQWTVMRWIGDADATDTADLQLPYNSAEGTDDRGRPVLLFNNTWSMQYFMENNPRVPLHDSPTN
ncbi:MAG: peptide chain release factor 3 [Spirochaetae bacterium HGW-Spirochaetae-1]|jgi:peptide chain release factor 3|nr:MAG: peptide chain release factor 3 [Spirochaetae bacterium HGW-Spirochaetae-1]